VSCSDIQLCMDRTKTKTITFKTKTITFKTKTIVFKTRDQDQDSNFQD